MLKSLHLRGAWDWLTRNMIDRALLTGIAFGALPLVWHSQAWFHSTLATWQVFLIGLAMGFAFVQYMGNVFGRYSFSLLQRFFPGSMQEMNARNILISLSMLWLGTFSFLGTVALVFHFTLGWFTAGSVLAVAAGAVLVGLCFALTHHANHTAGTDS